VSLPLEYLDSAGPIQPAHFNAGCTS
jgi:hypothetical protein